MQEMQNSIWGRRNPKIDDTSWEQLDLGKFQLKKPIVICLSGNATINEESANGFCKMAERLLGLKLNTDSSEDIYEYVDLIGVSYAPYKKSGTGCLTDEEIDNMVDSIMLPLCVDNKGKALSIDQVCKNLSVEIAGIRLGIVTEDGATYVQEIAGAVNDDIKKMLKSQRNCSLVEASLFSSMSYYSRAIEGEKRVKNLETQIALYQANVNRLKKENEELKIKLLNNGK